MRHWIVTFYLLFLFYKTITREYINRTDFWVIPKTIVVPLLCKGMDIKMTWKCQYADKYISKCWTFWCDFHLCCFWNQLMFWSCWKAYNECLSVSWSEVTSPFHVFLFATISELILISLIGRLFNIYCD